MTDNVELNKIDFQGKLDEFTLTNDKNIVPLSAAALAILFLGEELKAYHLIGAALVLGGVSLVTGVFTRTHEQKSGVNGSRTYKVPGA